MLFTFHTAAVGIKACARFLINHSTGGVRGGRQAHVEDVYAREEVAREAQPEARLAQRFAEWFEVLEQQLAALTVARLTSTPSAEFTICGGGGGGGG
ncbi:hypothetical protein Acr_00g0044090 [Actinidia rufa]|uniref:Uncharacterized protein n=1 Tax=Actinidia rufa TaxID=165716 RepID=A0A7J0DIT5_9ERIC|nr:hypothetical protein Acr_00g0044090 [Actinidia rufa]